MRLQKRKYQPILEKYTRQYKQEEMETNANGDTVKTCIKTEERSNNH